jgi:hypothetical protein
MVTGTIATNRGLVFDGDELHLGAVAGLDDVDRAFDALDRAAHGVLRGCGKNKARKSKAWGSEHPQQRSDHDNLRAGATLPLQPPWSKIIP